MPEPEQEIVRLPQSHSAGTSFCAIEQNLARVHGRRPSHRKQHFLCVGPWNTMAGRIIEVAARLH